MSSGSRRMQKRHKMFMFRVAITCSVVLGNTSRGALPIGAQFGIRIAKFASVGVGGDKIDENRKSLKEALLFLGGFGACSLLSTRRLGRWAARAGGRERLRRGA